MPCWVPGVAKGVQNIFACGDLWKRIWTPKSADTQHDNVFSWLRRGNQYSSVGILSVAITQGLPGEGWLRAP
jgi:hypothetical protein